MSFGETKVYYDGSHYIAIPHTTRNIKKRPKLIEDKITVVEENSNELSSTDLDILPNTDNSNLTDNVVEKQQDDEIKANIKVKSIQKLTKKEYFNKLYSEFIDLKRKSRKAKIIEKMRDYFDSEKECLEFVNLNFDRKIRNLICRRVRMIRKANLINFNYFCTFTYDNNLQSEQSFKKKLKWALGHFANRKNWKYMGVWERAPETKRLHFHGLFYIPENAMVGELFEHKDYSFSSHRRTVTIQNTYFNSRFGRSDFEPIKSNKDLMKQIQYVCKYLEKTEEKIVYSKGLYQYFISDIMDDDIICRIGQEEKKLLLYDDFKCFDEGVLIGNVSPEVIAQMRKCN